MPPAARVVKPVLCHYDSAAPLALRRDDPGILARIGDGDPKGTILLQAPRRHRRGPDRRAIGREGGRGHTRRLVVSIQGEASVKAFVSAILSGLLLAATQVAAEPGVRLQQVRFAGGEGVRPVAFTDGNREDGTADGATTFGNERHGSGGRGRQIRGMGGFCLDIEGGVRQGAPAIIFRCTGGANQRFQEGRGGELRVDGLCLDVEGGSRQNGARAIAWQCNGQRNQRWRISGNEIRSRASGMCLDVQEGRARPGQPVILWECNGQRNQRWRW